MTTISTVQSEYHNHSENEFERLVEVPVRDRNHLLELLSQVEDSHEEGREPIDTIFFGQFRGAPNGFSGSLAKRRSSTSRKPSAKSFTTSRLHGKMETRLVPS